MKRILKKWAAPLLCGLFIFLCMKFIFLIGYVPTASMEPTIAQGSYVFGIRVLGDLKLGDIVIFRHDGKTLMKRIAALPGHTVYFNDITRTVSVDADPLNATRILKVPENNYLLLGDNHDLSIDSRFWEDPFVSEDKIIAKVMLF